MNELPQYRVRPLRRSPHEAHPSGDAGEVLIQSWGIQIYSRLSSPASARSFASAILMGEARQRDVRRAKLAAQAWGVVGGALGAARE